jgi:hypothetical protein
MSSLAKTIGNTVKQEATGKVESVVNENVAGVVATMTTSDKKTQNRIKALAKLRDAAKDWGSATAAGGPAGAVYGAFKAGDNLAAGLIQGVTGEETPTIMEHVEKAALAKLKAAGAWVDKKLDNVRDSIANQLAASERKRYGDAGPAGSDLGGDVFGHE